MRYKLIAIGKLLDCGYNIFTPIENRHLEYDYLIEHNQQLQTVKVLPTHFCKNVLTCRLVFGNPPRLHSSTINLICCVRESTKQVWLIPFDVVSSCTTISLKERYDEFLLNEEVFSISKKTNTLTEVAKDIANKYKDNE